MVNTKPYLFNRAAIIGLGLIGGSLGMAFIQRNLIAEVVGIDLNEETIQSGMTLRAIHWGTTDQREGIKGADLVILGTPVNQIVPTALAIADCLAPGVIVSDVGSTKTGIVNRLEECLPGHVLFVGGHPMAGSEQQGVQNADPYLFENAVYVLTPTPKSSPQAVDRLQRLFEGIGAHVLQLSPTEHDLLVAAVSHLPHLVAMNLVNTVGKIAEKHPITWQLAAGGFRDTTRIASGDPALWRDICTANREPIRQCLHLFRESLDSLIHDLETGADEKILAGLIRAKDLRTVIPEKKKGLLPGIFEVVVNVPDRPGMIAQIANSLGERGLNIADIEILRVREGDGGTIRLGFTREETAASAFETLREQGLMARRR